ncbi:MAG TPA: hypothetical protein VEI02_12700, partial [Planctomycetota bacterium]|nr:hypothetical protein [Planctomycetota bacterium]
MSSVEGAALAWADWIAVASIQGALCASLAWMIDASLGRRLRPAWRGAMWTATALRFVVPPSWTSPLGGAWSAATEALGLGAGGPPN